MKRHGELTCCCLHRCDHETRITTIYALDALPSSGHTKLDILSLPFRQLMDPLLSSSCSGGKKVPKWIHVEEMSRGDDE